MRTRGSFSRKAVIYTVWTGLVATFQTHVVNADINSSVISGDEDSEVRQAVLKDFQSNAPPFMQRLLVALDHRHAKRWPDASRANDILYQPDSRRHRREEQIGLSSNP
jgi:hypothetical protein